MISYSLKIKNQSKFVYLQFLSYISYCLIRLFKIKIFTTQTPPYRLNKYTILRSPFIFSKAKEQYEIKWVNKIFTISLNELNKQNLAYQNETLWIALLTNPKFAEIEAKLQKNQKIKYKFFYK